MKVGKKILNFIFVLVIALSFTFIGVKSVVFKTIFNKEYVLEQMETNNFYSETYKLVESGFENYIGQSGLDEEVIKNICTEDKIKNDINITKIEYNFNGEEKTIDNINQKEYQLKLDLIDGTNYVIVNAYNQNNKSEYKGKTTK